MHPQTSDASAQPTRSPSARISSEAVLAWMREHLARLLEAWPERGTTGAEGRPGRMEEELG